MRRTASVAVMLVATVLEGSAALALAPLGPPFRVNTETAGNQGDGSASSCGYWKQRTQAVASDGNEFIVVWQSEGQDGDRHGVFAQRYDAAATPVGGEFQVHADPMHSQATPVVAKAPSGQFVVAWGSYEYGADVFARVFDASGTPLGPEFQVSENGYDAGGYRAYLYDAVRNPAIETDASGRFVVAWEREGVTEDGRDVMARRFDASGTPLGGAFQVSDPGYDVPYGSFYWNRSPDVAVSAAGEFVVVWSGIPASLGGYAVVAKRFDAAGAPVGGEFQVNTPATYTYNGMSYPVSSYFESTPDASFAASGDFIVAWSSSSMDEDESDYYDIAARFYDPSGTPKGAQFRVNTTTQEDEYQGSWEGCPTTARLADGNFVVSWQRYPDTPGAFGQVITPAGAKKDVEFSVGPGDPMNGRVRFPGVAPLGTNFVMAWTEAAGFAGNWDVYAQLVGEGTGPAPDCAPAPLPGCADTLTARTSTLAYSRRNGDPARGRLKWRWKGEATTTADFGNPRFDTGFAFCLYDASGAPQPLAQAQAPASGTCVSIPCWRALGGNVAALEYYNRLTNEDGILRLRLKPGVDQRSSVFVQGKGVNLGLPGAPLVAPVVAQVQGSNGSCWAATFGTYIRKNVTDGFTARSN